VRTEAWSGDDGAGLAVFDPATGGGFVLNRSTAVVFEACDGKTSTETMARRVADATGLPADVAIVELALAELRRSGLLEASTVAGGTIAESPTSSGLSRRTLIGRLALGAGAVALLPVIDAVGLSKLAAEPTSKSPQGAVPTLIVDPKTAATPAATAVDITLTSSGGFADPNIDTTYWISTEPLHGTVTVLGAIATYTPAAGFAGTDTFMYAAGQCVPFSDAGRAAQTGRVDAAVAVVAPACPVDQGMVPDGGSVPALVTVTVAEPATTTTTATAPAAAKPAAEVKASPSFTG
jgi:hypothetical protein